MVGIIHDEVGMIVPLAATTADVTLDEIVSLVSVAFDPAGATLDGVGSIDVLVDRTTAGTRGGGRHPRLALFAA